MEKFGKFSLLIFDSREFLCRTIAVAVRFSPIYWIVIDSSVISIYTWDDGVIKGFLII